MSIWFSADLHMSHRKATEKFKKPGGEPLRPFGSVEETDEAIISRFNSLIGPTDKLYLLGDLGWTGDGFNKLRRLNGRKIAVLGNHDRQSPAEYAEVFEEVHGALDMKDFMLTHVPIHPDCVGRFGLNVHGHLHSEALPDPRYFCVSVERNDFRPFHIDDILARKKLIAGGNNG